jgi:hypothetical protein
MLIYHQSCCLVIKWECRPEYFLALYLGGVDSSGGDVMPINPVIYSQLKVNGSPALSGIQVNFRLYKLD